MHHILALDVAFMAAVVRLPFRVTRAVDASPNGTRKTSEGCLVWNETRSVCN
jgi:hypothetical protein